MMSFKNIFFLLTALLIHVYSYAIKDTIEAFFYKEFSFDKEIITFETDVYSNIYPVFKNEIKRLDSNGKQIINFSFISTTPFTNISFRSKGELLVFFKDEGRILFLDNMLTPITSIKNINNKLNEKYIILVGFGFNNHLVLYDRIANQLIKTDKNFNIISESQDLNSLFDEKILPNKILYSSDNYFLFQKETGMVTFDLFTSFNNFYALPKVISVAVFDHLIFYLTSENKIKIYDTKTLSYSFVKFPEKYSKFIFKEVHYQKNKLYLSTQENKILLFKPFFDGF